ncbi:MULTISPECIES: DUF3397 family protein [Sporosarcina]|uniref:DUF3397 family protein n=1 Tax=Sporosarcina contaminans TaxID=633403 RepID=A0ABW3TVM6_9BACL
MGSILSFFAGILVLCPFLIALVFLIVVRKFGRAPATYIGRAADVTTPFLFLSVYALSVAVFGRGTGIYLAGIAMLIGMIYAILERFRVKEYKILRLLQKTWRLYFLLLTAAYVVLMAAGVILNVISYTK